MYFWKKNVKCPSVKSIHMLKMNKMGYSNQTSSVYIIKLKREREEEERAVISLCNPCL